MAGPPGSTYATDREVGHWRSGRSLPQCHFDRSDALTMSNQLLHLKHPDVLRLILPVLVAALCQVVRVGLVALELEAAYTHGGLLLVLRGQRAARLRHLCVEGVKL